MKTDYEERINKRLQSVLTDVELRPYCQGAYTALLQGLGFSDSGLHAENILDILQGDNPLGIKEREIQLYWSSLTVNDLPLQDHLLELTNERRQIMLEQLRPHLLMSGRALDFGAGSGEFMRLVSNEFPDLEIEGWDVVPDDAAGQVHTYEGKHILRDDGYFDQVYATTVLHHLDDESDGAAELVRLTNRRIILIETIPAVRTAKREKDWNITFTVDYFWRIVHQSHEPVPGSYLTVFEWIELFVKKLGCTLIAFEDLGHDQKTMTEKHVLFVFEK